MLVLVLVLALEFGKGFPAPTQRRESIEKPMIGAQTFGNASFTRPSLAGEELL